MAGFRITTIHAWVAVDPKDGDEGVIGMTTPGGWLPFVAADEERLRSLEHKAREIGAEFGVTVRLVRFSVREDLLELAPGAAGPE